MPDGVHMGGNYCGIGGIAAQCGNIFRTHNNRAAVYKLSCRGVDDNNLRCKFINGIFYKIAPNGIACKINGFFAGGFKHNAHSIRAETVFFIISIAAEGLPWMQPVL